eukprot:377954_1
MLPSNTIRFIQNTIDSTQSHNKRLHVNHIWKQRDNCHKKRKRKRKRSEFDKSNNDEYIDNNWHDMHQIRKQNAKKKKTNLESIMLGKWDHDKFDRMQKQPQKTLFDALQSLKCNKPKTNKYKSNNTINNDNDSESDIDLMEQIKKRKKINTITININSISNNTNNKQINEELTDIKQKSKKKKRKRKKHKKKHKKSVNK